MNSPKIEVMPDDYEEEKKPVQEKKVEEKFEDKIEEKQEDVFQKMEDLDIKSEELSEEEKQIRLKQALSLKERGNVAFNKQQFSEAIDLYTDAIQLCPKGEIIASTFYSNRAACFVHFEKWKDVVEDCSEAIKLDGKYVEALFRRAQAYEKLEEYGKAAKDHEELFILDPTNIKAKITGEELRKKETENLMKSAKGVANKLLGFIGLSTDNFKFEQNETGGYSMQFVQNTPKDK